MTSEINISGKTYRYYIAGRIYVAEDGFAASQTDINIS